MGPSYWGDVVVVIVWCCCIYNYNCQSVPIITKVVARSTRYNIM